MLASNRADEDSVVTDDIDSARSHDRFIVWIVTMLLTRCVVMDDEGDSLTRER